MSLGSEKFLPACGGSFSEVKAAEVLVLEISFSWPKAGEGFNFL